MRTCIPVIVHHECVLRCMQKTISPGFLQEPTCSPFAFP